MPEEVFPSPPKEQADYERLRERIAGFARTFMRVGERLAADWSSVSMPDGDVRNFVRGPSAQGTTLTFHKEEWLSHDDLANLLREARAAYEAFEELQKRPAGS